MNINIRAIAEGGILIFIVFIILFILWFILKRTRTNNKLHPQDALLSGEELDSYARKTAIEHTTSSQSQKHTWPITKLNENYDFILSVYKDLNEDIQHKRPVPPAAEWLLDNFYIIEEQVKGIRLDLNKKTIFNYQFSKTEILKDRPVSLQ